MDSKIGIIDVTLDYFVVLVLGKCEVLNVICVTAKAGKTISFHLLI